MQQNTCRKRGAICRQYTLTADGIRLSYELSAKWLPEETRMAYSISITNLTDGDSACAADVSSLEQTAAALFDTLIDGQVTPCTLFDVLEDLL